MIITSTLKLSIIIPIYNAEKYLNECIESLYQQDLETSQYEVILINDGSIDNSYNIAEQWANRHANIRLFSQDNQGQSVARNKGLDVAKGKYIMFVDSDDKLFPNVIGKILNLAEKNDLEVCAYRIKYFDEYGQMHSGSIQPFPSYKIFDGRFAVTHGADIGAVWLNLYSREMLEKNHLRFLHGIYHQDVDFNLRMFAYVDRIMFTDIVAYNYRYVAGSSTRKPNKKRIIKLISDDLIVVRHIRDFSQKDEYGKVLKSFYIRHGNSLLVSILLQLKNNPDITKDEKLMILHKMKELGLYPIRGCSQSWKTTLLSLPLSIECLYKKLF